MKMILNKYFLLCPFFIFTSSLFANSFSQNEYEIVKNWTNNSFWERQINKMDEILCNALSARGKICNQKSPQEAREDIDYLKFLECKSLIKQKFPKQLVMDKENLIKDDCVSIYEKYKNDSKFSNDGFTSDYITFAKNYSYSKFENSRYEKCLKASDFKGCMDYEEKNSIVSIETQNISKDCSYEWCSPTETNSYIQDSSGKPLLKNHYFLDSPRSRSAYYISPIYKLRVNGQYGRFIHISYIFRNFLNARSGTSGYLIGGSNKIDCYPTGSSYTSPSYTCSSQLPTYIPGTPGRPSGVVQNTMDWIFDCDQEIFSQHFKGRFRKSVGRNGKKYKWIAFNNAKNNLINNSAIDFCRTNRFGINTLKPSGFLKFSNKKIKNPKGYSAINKGVNCNSPVWKNKPRCS